MESTSTKPRLSVVEQLAKGQKPRHEPEVEETTEAYQEARSRSREALMLDLRFANGRVKSFDYAHLAKSEFLPEGRIVLRFGRDEVTAEGKNLLRLYNAITEHRARFMQEGTEEEEELKAEDAAHIDTITIREGIEES
jgi:hypothetical protein